MIVPVFFCLLSKVHSAKNKKLFLEFKISFVNDAQKTETAPTIRKPFSFTSVCWNTETLLHFFINVLFYFITSMFELCFYFIIIIFQYVFYFMCQRVLFSILCILCIHFILFYIICIICIIRWVLFSILSTFTCFFYLHLISFRSFLMCVISFLF